MKKLKLYQVELWSHGKNGDKGNVESFTLLATDAADALRKAQRVPHTEGDYVADLRVIDTVDQ